MPYRDVIFEDSLKVGGATKAPDYCFRIGGIRKFVVEAKKPSVNIATDVSPALQLRRYAWSAKLPLSILTDFEELAVYDCRSRPNRTDKASTARIKPEAIRKGSFDKYVVDTKVRKGTAEVDDAFLAQIEDWRDALARGGQTAHGPQPTAYSPRPSDSRPSAVSRKPMADADRGIEDYGTLRGLIRKPGGVRACA